MEYAIPRISDILLMLLVFYLCMNRQKQIFIMLYSKIEGQGQPLIILHGFLGMSDNWKTLGVQYAENGFEVHLLDLRNHGRSLHADEFTYEVMVQDVVEYCAEKNLVKIDVIGHSMGGKVAMLLAATHSDLVEKLIVADIGPKFYPQHHQEILAGLSAVDFSAQPSRADVEDILTPYIKDAGTRQFLMKSLYWKSPEQLAFRFNLAVFNQNLEAIGKPLASDLIFDKPTLFIRGGASSYVLDSDFEMIQQHFPKVVVETVPKAGHWLHAENPKLFYELSTSFLRQ